MELLDLINAPDEDPLDFLHPVVSPIVQTSNFSFKNVRKLRDAMADPYHEPYYSRADNPTINILRKKLAALDGAEDALIFGSGIAAITIPIISLLKPGDHIICVNGVYGWTRKSFDHLFKKFQILTTYVDGSAIENFQKAIRPTTRLIYMESPTSFSFEIQNISQIAILAKKSKIITMIDNSFSTPLHQRPHTLGVDLVCQSATKYLNGHGDILAGVVTGSKNLIKEIYLHEFMMTGAIISPFSAWLLLRGLRTLPMRLKHITNTTIEVIQRVKNHPAIEELIYPLANDFPQYELAAKQMTGAGGLFTIILRDHSLEAIENFCNSLKTFLLAASWGGFESIVMPFAASLPSEEFDPTNRRHRMIRLYLGLQEPTTIINDLANALSLQKRKLIL